MDQTRTPKTVSRLSYRILTGVVIGAVILIISIVCWGVFNMSEVNSFEACAKKYPVMESYPERCRTPDGRLFVRPLP